MLSHLLTLTVGLVLGVIAGALIWRKNAAAITAEAAKIAALKAKL